MLNKHFVTLGADCILEANSGIEWTELRNNPQTHELYKTLDGNTNYLQRQSFMQHSFEYQEWQLFGILTTEDQLLPM